MFQTTHYLDSRFFKRPNAENIVTDLLTTTIATLPEKKMLVLWMGQTQAGVFWKR